MAEAVGPDDTDNDDAGRMVDVIVDVVGVCCERGGKRDDDDVGGGGGGANVPATATAVAAVA